MRFLARLRCALPIALLAGSLTGNLAAQPMPAGEPTPAARPAALADTAALIVHNRPVVVFRAPIGALSPADRAAAASRRLEALLEAAGADDSVSTRSIPQGVLVLVGGRGVFTVTPDDADTLSGGRLDLVAARAALRLRTAIAAAREERSLPGLLWAIGLSVLATLAFLVAIRTIRWLRARVMARIPAGGDAADAADATAAEDAARAADAADAGVPDRPMAGRLPTVQVGGFTLLSTEGALALLRRVVDLVFWAAGLFAAYLWLAFVLTRFSYTRPWGEALGGYLYTTIRDLALTAASAVPGLFTVVVILVVTRWVARLINAFFAAVEAGTVDVPWVHPETASPTRRIATVLLWLFAIVVAYPYVPGSGSDVFKGVSVFAGLVISLGSSGIVNQAMSGLVLMYSRALKPGDFVRIGEIEGVVTTLGMLSTKIRTTKREEITLPNAVVVTTNVRNYSRLSVGEGVILHTAVTIGYDVPWRQVEAMLVLAATRTEGLREDPPPFVLKTGLSDFYIEYQLNAHLDVPERRARVLSALHEHVVDVFNEHEVQILSPHYESDPPIPAVVPRERWYAAPARPPDSPAG